MFEGILSTQLQTEKDNLNNKRPRQIRLFENKCGEDQFANNKLICKTMQGTVQ